VWLGALEIFLGVKQVAMGREAEMARTMFRVHEKTQESETAFSPKKKLLFLPPPPLSRANKQRNDCRWIIKSPSSAIVLHFPDVHAKGDEGRVTIFVGPGFSRCFCVCS
jgi:hypothetical protein